MPDQISESINTYEDDTIKPGMLSSPHIAYCIHKYGIIKDHDDSCLDSAAYNMRIGGKVFTWEGGKKTEFALGDEDDKNRNIRHSFELKPNSLNFVTTIEKFNLPKDIIARFNLKSKWVHEGLLLGTGPILDPELSGHILIPLHNFSNQCVSLNYKDKLISVEFTKTLNPADEFDLDGERFIYVPNKSRHIDYDGYRKRTGRKVESSVSSEFAKYRKQVKVFTWIGIGTFAATFVGLISLVFTSWTVVNGARKDVIDAQNAIAGYVKMIDGETTKSSDKYEKEIKSIQERLKILEEKTQGSNIRVKAK